LGVFNRRAHEPTLRESAIWSAVWIGVAVLFGAAVWIRMGQESGLEFAAAYLVEKSLSLDNVFVFAAIFAAFAVPRAQQHRVLFWGIVGALVMRAIFIFAGVALLQRFHWLLYVFGALLVVLGAKFLLSKKGPADPEQALAVRAARKLLPVGTLDGSRFTSVQGGRRVATPLLLSLVAAESADLLFALDSIPAVFAITEDAFVLYTSNVFAMFGLRSLYALLAGAMGRLRYLHVGLAVVLVFVGLKLVVAPVFHVGIAASLAVIAGVLAIAIAASVTPAARRVPQP
jgi:tellurite resistance protein TerC